MAYNLLLCDREQDYLMPPSLREWLAEGELAWFIVDAVEQVELREFYAGYPSTEGRMGGSRLRPSDNGSRVAICLLPGYPQFA